MIHRSGKKLIYKNCIFYLSIKIVITTHMHFVNKHKSTITDHLYWIDLVLARDLYIDSLVLVYSI